MLSCVSLRPSITGASVGVLPSDDILWEDAERRGWLAPFSEALNPSILHYLKTENASLGKLFIMGIHPTLSYEKKQLAINKLVDSFDDSPLSQLCLDFSPQTELAVVRSHILPYCNQKILSSIIAKTKLHTDQFFIVTTHWIQDILLQKDISREQKSQFLDTFFLSMEELVCLDNFYFLFFTRYAAVERKIIEIASPKFKRDLGALKQKTQRTFDSFRLSGELRGKSSREERLYLLELILKQSCPEMDLFTDHSRCIHLLSDDKDLNTELKKSMYSLFCRDLRKKNQDLYNLFIISTNSELSYEEKQHEIYTLSCSWHKLTGNAIYKILKHSHCALLINQTLLYCNEKTLLLITNIIDSRTMCDWIAGILTSEIIPPEEKSHFLDNFYLCMEQNTCLAPNRLDNFYVLFLEENVFCEELIKRFASPTFIEKLDTLKQKTASILDSALLSPKTTSQPFLSLAFHLEDALFRQAPLAVIFEKIKDIFLLESNVSEKIRTLFTEAAPIFKKPETLEQLATFLPKDLLPLFFCYFHPLMEPCFHKNTFQWVDITAEMLIASTNHPTADAALDAFYSVASKTGALEFICCQLCHKTMLLDEVSSSMKFIKIMEGIFDKCLDYRESAPLLKKIGESFPYGIIPFAAHLITTLFQKGRLDQFQDGGLMVFFLSLFRITSEETALLAKELNHRLGDSAFLKLLFSPGLRLPMIQALHMYYPADTEAKFIDWIICLVNQEKDSKEKIKLLSKLISIFNKLGYPIQELIGNPILIPFHPAIKEWISTEGLSECGDPTIALCILNIFKKETLSVDVIELFKSLLLKYEKSEVLSSQIRQLFCALEKNLQQEILDIPEIRAIFVASFPLLLNV